MPYYRTLAPLTKTHWISNPCFHPVTLKQTSFLFYFAVSDHVPDQFKDLLSASKNGSILEEYLGI